MAAAIAAWFAVSLGCIGGQAPPDAPDTGLEHDPLDWAVDQALPGDDDDDDAGGGKRPGRHGRGRRDHGGGGGAGGGGGDRHGGGGGGDGRRRDGDVGGGDGGGGGGGGGGGAPDPQPNGHVTYLGGTHWQVTRGALVGWTEDPGKLGANASPKSGGYVLSGVRAGSDADALGAEDGDLVTEVNGKALTSTTDLLQLYASVKTAKVFHVTLKRAGETRSHTYDVVD